MSILCMKRSQNSGLRKSNDPWDAGNAIQDRCWYMKAVIVAQLRPLQRYSVLSPDRMEGEYDPNQGRAPN